MNSECQTPGCGNPLRARGYCSGCYNRARADGVLPLALPRRTDDLCVTCRERDRMPRQSYCRQCASARERERYRRNPEEFAARQRANYDPRRSRADKLRRYGLTVEQFDELARQQGGACAVCERVTDELFVDHDHACCPERFKSCGKCIRGLLCTNCNAGLGQFGDDIARLMNACAYLVRASEGASMAATWVEYLEGGHHA